MLFPLLLPLLLLSPQLLLLLLLFCCFCSRRFSNLASSFCFFLRTPFFRFTTSVQRMSEAGAS